MPTSWVFPGQGSQYVGMARDLYENYSSARAALDAADAVLGFSLSRLMFQGPEAELTDTVNTQPALLAHSVAALAALNEAAGRPLPDPAFCAGHSLGEYSALVAAGALDLTDGLRLVRARGVAMKRAGELRPGAMAAVLGLDPARLDALSAGVSGIEVANYNAPGQVVLSGERAALEQLVADAKAAGAKRAIVLAVSIAAHSELMRPAVEEFRAAVEAAPLRLPRVPVVSNVTARPLLSVDEIRAELLAQLTSPVRWSESVEYMAAQGVTEFLEIGAKEVLTGLGKRIAPHALSRPLGTVEQITQFLTRTGAVA